MFKIIVLTAILAVASAHVAAPILSKTVHYEAAPVIKTIISEPSHVAVHEPTVARVGEIVESVPTAVSHQSSTIVHSRANIVTPIVAPAVKTHIAPIVKNYEAPILTVPHPAPAPIFKAIETHAPAYKTFEEAPILKTYAAPAPILETIESHAPILKTYAAPAPIVKTYETHAPILNTYAAPAPIYKTFESAPIYKTFESAPIYKSYAAAAPLHYSAPVLQKSIHYAAQPYVTGYSQTILKPKLHESFLSGAPTLTYGAPALSEEIRYSEPKFESIQHSHSYPSAW